MNGKHRWAFSARFRRHAFGWRSQPAITRIREAVSEIKKAVRSDLLLAAEGAVLLLEKLSPALEQVDSSSGAIGTAVNHAIDALVPVISEAPAGEQLRSKWLDRLWQAVQDDDMPYIETLTDYWGDLCATSECASRWADHLVDTVRLAWSPDPSLRGYFKGTTACLSALLKAGRNQEIMDLLELSPHKSWHYRQWGVRALAAMGKRAEALRYAESGGDPNDSPFAIARVCEEILLSSGMSEEAYARYATLANQQGTYLATFRTIARKYPGKSAAEILRDLVGSTPGEEGKWFAAARSAGLYREAIELANRTPCDPRTLARAARDMAAEEPRFALEAGIAALRWLAEGYGYEITRMEVWQAYASTMKAADGAGCRVETLERIRRLLARATHGSFVLQAIGREQEFSGLGGQPGTP